ncbi:MAG TPA: hypothetical protein VFT87_00030 [Candidatus Saccharimonadales bacterium]|nr:hypothetical protein [Candidatus Saccharimonadales bacterium]
MNVHIAGSRYKITENIDNLRRIIDAVHEEGHSLDRDWIEPTYQSVKQGKEVPELDWVLIYKESLEAIHRADVVIADSTIPSFSVGFQVATAVQMKKPILILNKEGIKDSLFPRGIEVGVSYKAYDDKTLKAVVKEFLHENDIQLKDMRFNFFIDRPIYNYLRWSAHKTGKTKAEILRELVLREIEKQ